jgi:hypothetical protein
MYNYAQNKCLSIKNYLQLNMNFEFNFF